MNTNSALIFLGIASVVALIIYLRVKGGHGGYGMDGRRRSSTAGIMIVLTLYGMLAFFGYRVWGIDFNFDPRRWPTHAGTSRHRVLRKISMRIRHAQNGNWIHAPPLNIESAPTPLASIFKRRRIRIFRISMTELSKYC